MYIRDVVRKAGYKMAKYIPCLRRIAENVKEYRLIRLDSSNEVGSSTFYMSEVFKFLSQIGMNLHLFVGIAPLKESKQPEFCLWLCLQ